MNDDEVRFEKVCSGLFLILSFLVVGSSRRDGIVLSVGRSELVGSWTEDGGLAVEVNMKGTRQLWR